MAFEGSGLSEDIIENYEDFSEVLQSLQCVICLDVVKDPVQCPICESLYCAGCWKMLKISGKKCSMKCGSEDTVKANKFVYNILNKLKIKCPNCHKGGITYSAYVLHEELCTINEKYGQQAELERVLQEKVKEITNIKSGHANKNMPSKEEIRRRLVTAKLQVNQKMELYKAAIEGRLADFKDLVLKKGYPILEEVSAMNYYWTPLHYAMHYGKVEIINFILDTMKARGDLNIAMNLQSSDNRCPIQCLLKSNAVTIDVKKNIIVMLFQRYDFDISRELLQEIRNRNLEGLIPKLNK